MRRSARSWAPRPTRTRAGSGSPRRARPSRRSSTSSRRSRPSRPSPSARSSGSGGARRRRSPTCSTSPARSPTARCSAPPTARTPTRTRPTAARATCRASGGATRSRTIAGGSRRRRRPSSSSGAVDPEKALALARRRLGGWKGPRPRRPRVPGAPPPVERRVVVVDKPDATQVQVRIALPALARSTPEYFPALVANAVFGGGFTSRLMEAIRVNRGLSYGVRSRFAMSRGGRHLLRLVVHEDRDRGRARRRRARGGARSSATAAPRRRSWIARRATSPACTRSLSRRTISSRRSSPT